MSRKEDLEKLILDSYQIIYKNNQKISTSEPRERSRLRQENDEIWEYIKEFLTDYASLCEARKLVALEDIIDIAATRSPEVATRLEAASTTSISVNPIPQITRPGSSSSSDAGEKLQEVVFKPTPSPLSPVNNASLFQMDYQFVRPFVHNDREEVARFSLSFRSNAALPSASSNYLVKHICLVLDVSGSMNRPNKYPYLLEAIPHVVDSLADQDRLTIILFSTESELVWSMDVASSRLQTDAIRRKIDQSHVKFSATHLAPGLRIALDQIQRFHQSVPNAIDRLYILTDGQLHDEAECTHLNPELRRFEIETNSFGFGQDFAEATMREIMQGCPGGRVKWIADTDTLLGEFYHIGEVARNIIATNAELELLFSSSTTPGDAFRYEPGRYSFGSIDDRTRRFYVSIGPLEKGRSYMYAFEARIYAFSNSQQKLATAVLKYTVDGIEYTLTRDIVVNRSRERTYIEQVHKETETSFLILEEFRTNDPFVLAASLRARLNLLRNDEKNKAQAVVLQAVIEKLERDQTIFAITDDEKRQMRSDNITVKPEGF